MKRVVVVLVAVVLAAIAWLVWGSGGGPRVDDLAGVYRFDPHAGIEAGKTKLGPDYEPTKWEQIALQMLKTGELTLNPDSSLMWKMDEWIERGRWEVKDDRVFLFVKRKGRREAPIERRGLLVRDGMLIYEIADPPFVLRKQ